MQRVQASEQAVAALDDGSVLTWGDPRRGDDSSAIQAASRSPGDIALCPGPEALELSVSGSAPGRDGEVARPPPIPSRPSDYLLSPVAETTPAALAAGLAEGDIAASVQCH